MQVEQGESLRGKNSYSLFFRLLPGWKVCISRTRSNLINQLQLKWPQFFQISNGSLPPSRWGHYYTSRGICQSCASRFSGWFCEERKQDHVPYLECQRMSARKWLHHLRWFLLIFLLLQWNIHLYLLPAKCIREMSLNATPYNVELVLNENRHVTGARCSCVAGITGQCKHTAALVFHVNNERSTGCTDVEQSWSKPSEKLKQLYPKGRNNFGSWLP